MRTLLSTAIVTLVASPGCLTLASVQDYGIEPAPSFTNCQAWPRRDFSGIDVFALWIGRYRDPNVQSGPLELHLEDTFNRSFTFMPWARVDTMQDAYAISLQRQEFVVAAFTNRTTIRTDDTIQAGAQCGNFVYVSLVSFWPCPQVILSHEMGHVLGLTHTELGLMRPRPSCSDTELQP